MKPLMNTFLLLALASGLLTAQDMTGRWTGTADTIDASGVKRSMLQTIEFKGSGKERTALLVGRRGGGIPLKIIQEGEKFTLLGDIEFEGGEHLRWYLELMQTHLTGKVWALHDAPKKWGDDWTGPVDFTREAQ